jgi:hypothetical protein
MQGRVDQASAVIQKLHGGENERSRDFAALEIDQMTRQIESEKMNSVSWLTLLTAKRYRRRMILTALVMAMSQVAALHHP